ncbi:hypothetical protein ILYODFUR_039143 [Ilyodon furcidens]|uniref:Uncharacterized protein n=1 Tax=Ilyodon furcidens TaxID=33524 RepID=A0ABV0TT67_9TELE
MLEILLEPPTTNLDFFPWITFAGQPLLCTLQSDRVRPACSPTRPLWTITPRCLPAQQDSPRLASLFPRADPSPPELLTSGHATL